MAEKKQRDKRWQTPLAKGALRPRQQRIKTFSATPAIMQDKAESRETAALTDNPDRHSMQIVESELIEAAEAEQTAVPEPEPEIIEAAPVETNIIVTEIGETEIVTNPDISAEFEDEELVQDAEPGQTNAEMATMPVTAEAKSMARPCLAEFVAYETAVVAGVVILGTTLYGWFASGSGLETAVRIGLLISSTLALGLIAATFTVFARCKQRSRAQDNA